MSVPFDLIVLFFFKQIHIRYHPKHSTGKENNSCCPSAGILDTILRIATEGAACGDRRREDVYRFIPQK